MKRPRKIRAPKPTRAEMKAKLLAKAESTIEEFLDWVEQTDHPNLTQIEDTVLEFRRHLGQDLAETAIQAQANAQPALGPTCPKCGREMHYKDEKNKTITSRVSELKLSRRYYHCTHCHQGLFPPRPTTPRL
jgi:hypothetical protein